MFPAHSEELLGGGGHESLSFTTGSLRPAPVPPPPPPPQEAGLLRLCSGTPPPTCQMSLCVAWGPLAISGAGLEASSPCVVLRLAPLLSSCLEGRMWTSWKGLGNALQSRGKASSQAGSCGAWHQGGRRVHRALECSVPWQGEAHLEKISSHLLGMAGA